MTRPALLLAAALLPLSLVPARAAPAETEHVVAQGETLNGIANRAGVTGDALARLNGLKPPYALHTGQKLKLPRASSRANASAKASPPKPVATRTVAKTAGATPANGPALVQESMHLVTEGETLGGIANRAKVPRVLIAEANGLTPPYDVQPGRKLLIPRTRHYVVKPGDTGFAIAYKHGVPWSQIAVANGLDAQTPVKPGKALLIPTVFDPQLPSQSARSAATSAAAASAAASAAVAASAPAGRDAPRLAWPLQGSLKRGWKSRGAADYHDGLDIGAAKGAPVRAAAAGTVLYAGNEKEQFGNLVVLDHGNGWNTAYGFLSKVTVKKGARVASGERIGLTGNTGKARGNELHFEVRQDGVPIDPEPELARSR